MSSPRPASSPRTLLVAVVLSLGLLGAWGVGASATTPAVIPIRDTGGVGGGSGLVAGVQETPREEHCPICRLTE